MNGISKKQRGMTLLEVVISMLIIGLGLAMCVSMIQTSIRSTYSANNQNIAAELAESIVSRMRINRIAADGYLFGDNNGSSDNTGDFDLYDSGWSAPSSAVSAPTCDDCTEEQKDARDAAYAQAYADAVNWLSEVQDSLPNGRASIVDWPVVGTTPGYRVILQWKNIPMNSRNQDEAASFDDLPSQQISLGFSL